MPGAAYPPNLLEPIASSAAGTEITNPMPDAPTGTNAASVQGGFPPITMLNELAGGQAPLGQDFNGYLFLITSHTMYVQCGQLYLYNATLAADIGGYLTGTILGMADGAGMWLNVLNGNTSNPDTGGAGWVPMAAYGFAAVSGLTGGIVPLTAAQSRFPVVVFTGVLTSNLTVQFPQTKQEWLVINGTTGAFTLNVKTAASGSTGVGIPQGGYSAPVSVYSIGDGNLYPSVAPLAVPIDQSPNPLTIAERTNNGYLLATYFNSSAALENPSVGAVVVQNAAADGFHRKISLTNFEAQLLLQQMGGAVINAQVPYGVVQQWAASLHASPTLTGVPVAPTAATGTSSTQVATTAFANPAAVLSGSGYCKLPSGLILQWGSVGSGSGSTVADFVVTFPIAFPANVIGAWVASNRNIAGAGQAANGSGFTSNYTLSGMVATIDASGSPGPYLGRWFALGY